MRREARANAKEEWRVRSRRVLDALIEACGGEAAERVVKTPGKVVRVDYLRRAIDDLTRDDTSEGSFFFRGLPVNVEAWLRALCAHDVATYVPTRWRTKRSRRATDDATGSGELIGSSTTGRVPVERRARYGTTRSSARGSSILSRRPRERAD